VASVEAQGKHLLIGFDDGRVLHSHLGMHGRWRVGRPGARGAAVLELDGLAAVLTGSHRIELRRGRELELRLGPDILAPDLDLAEVLRRARASRQETLGELLLDQHVCAGIGNIWKCESLWRLGLWPWQPVGQTDDGTLRRLYLQARELMQASVAGRRPLQGVHDRARRPCPRCSTPVRAVRQGGERWRWTYFCPTCQPAPSGGDPLIPARDE
jgi:endonuclease VIII